MARWPLRPSGLGGQAALAARRPNIVAWARGYKGHTFITFVILNMVGLIITNEVNLLIV